MKKNQNTVNTFDDAEKESKKMFQNKIDENKALEDEKASSERIARAEREASGKEEAALLAESAAAAAKEKDEQLSQAMARLDTLKRENAEIKELLKFYNDARKEELIDAAAPEQPRLNLDKLRELDGDSAKALENEYAKNMLEYANKLAMKKVSPMLRNAEIMNELAMKSELIHVLDGVPELTGIAGMGSQLDRIIAGNKLFQNKEIPLDEKYIAAYAIAKGIDSICNPKKQPAIEELIEIYNENPEFQNAVEKQRAAKIKSDTHNIPVFSGSSGNGSIALDVPEKPKSFEEAGEFVRKLFSAK